MLARVSRLLVASLLGSAFVVGFAAEASAQVTATCSLNEVENRVYNLVPLEGTLKSTEEQLTPDLPFRQYLPNGHDPAKKWPVIIFLHGIGEVGGTLQKVTEHSLPRMVEAPEWDWPFIVLSPVLPDPGWLARAQLVSDIFDYAVNTLGGDPNRLYLTGVSHGGEGTLAIGIELAAKVAALMPVTPGGEPDNWANHAAIASKPNLIIIGTADSQYANSQGWATDLETAGGPMFNDYTLPAADEHLDTIPATILDQSHVFISYQDLPHDIWHAAYGNFCNDMAMLTTYKTVQYEWLLKQSLDGSPFVDPRDGAPPVGGAGGTAGAAGSAGGGAGGAGSGGVGGGGSGGAPVVSAGAGGMTTMVPSAGSGGSAPIAANSQAAQESGCALVRGSRGSSAALWLLLVGLGSTLFWRSRGTRR